MTYCTEGMFAVADHKKAAGLIDAKMEELVETEKTYRRCRGITLYHIKCINEILEINRDGPMNS